MVILLLVSMTGIVIAENEEYTYLGYLNFYSQGWVKDFTDKPIDESRAVLAELSNAGVVVTAVLILPDGIESKEDNSYAGVRMTFDKPLDAILEDYGAEEYAILEPIKVEVAGEVINGSVVEIGEDYVILDVYEEGQWTSSANNIRYTITPDTLNWYDYLSFDAGSGCRMIVDNEGVVLAMNQQNG
jgi:hypothetical protein